MKLLILFVTLISTLSFILGETTGEWTYSQISAQINKDIISTGNKYSFSDPYSTTDRSDNILYLMDKLYTEKSISTYFIIVDKLNSKDMQSVDNQKGFLTKVIKDYINNYDEDLPSKNYIFILISTDDLFISIKSSTSLQNILTDDVLSLIESQYYKYLFDSNNFVGYQFILRELLNYLNKLPPSWSSESLLYYYTQQYNHSNNDDIKYSIFDPTNTLTQSEKNNFENQIEKLMNFSDTLFLNTYIMIINRINQVKNNPVDFSEETFNIFNTTIHPNNRNNTNEIFIIYSSEENFLYMRIDGDNEQLIINSVISHEIRDNSTSHFKYSINEGFKFIFKKFFIFFNVHYRNKWTPKLVSGYINGNCADKRFCFNTNVDIMDLYKKEKFLDYVRDFPSFEPYFFLIWIGNSIEPYSKNKTKFVEELWNIFEKQNSTSLNQTIMCIFNLNNYSDIFSMKIGNKSKEYITQQDGQEMIKKMLPSFLEKDYYNGVLTILKEVRRKIAIDPYDWTPKSFIYYYDDYIIYERFYNEINLENSNIDKEFNDYLEKLNTEANITCYFFCLENISDVYTPLDFDVLLSKDFTFNKTEDEFNSIFIFFSKADNSYGISLGTYLRNTVLNENIQSIQMTVEKSLKSTYDYKSNFKYLIQLLLYYSLYKNNQWNENSIIYYFNNFEEISNYSIFNPDSVITEYYDISNCLLHYLKRLNYHDIHVYIFVLESSKPDIIDEIKNNIAIPVNNSRAIFMIWSDNDNRMDSSIGSDIDKIDPEGLRGIIEKAVKDETKNNFRKIRYIVGELTTNILETNTDFKGWTNETLINYINSFFEIGEYGFFDIYSKIEDGSVYIFDQIKKIYETNHVSIYSIIINNLTNDSNKENILENIIDNFNFPDGVNKTNSIFILESFNQLFISIWHSNEISGFVNRQFCSKLEEEAKFYLKTNLYDSLLFITTKIETHLNLYNDWTPKTLATKFHNDHGSENYYYLYDPYEYLNSTYSQKLKDYLSIFYAKEKVNTFCFIINKANEEYKNLSNFLKEYSSNLTTNGLNDDYYLYVLFSISDEKIDIKAGNKTSNKLSDGKIKNIVNSLNITEPYISKNLFNYLDFVFSRVKKEIIFVFPNWAISLIVIFSLIILGTISFFLVKFIKNKGDKIAGFNEVIELRM